MPKKLYIGILLALVLTALLCGCGMGFGGESTPAPVFTPVPKIDSGTPSEPLVLSAPAEVLDGNVNSYMTDVTITAEEPIGSLYILWHLIPGEWVMIADGEEILCGADGYLQEYVVLDKPAKQITIKAEQAVTDVYAFAPDAVLPDWVHVWKQPLERADLMLVSTHADDEHIFFGGMMPYYAVERNLKVQVIYFVNHWGEPFRGHEQLNGLWTVGIRNYPIVGHFYDYWADNLQDAESKIGRDAAVEFLVEQLRRFKPRVVIGHDLEGEYGHGMHILNAYALTDAVELAGLETYYPESAEQYGRWNTPKLYLHLYPRNEILMDWEAIALTSFDYMSAMDVARAGFACHHSQQGIFYVYGEKDFYDSRLFGLYRSTVGPDKIGGDVFENITEYY